MIKSRRLEVPNHPSKFIKLRKPRELIFITAEYQCIQENNISFRGSY